MERPSSEKMPLFCADTKEIKSDAEKTVENLIVEDLNVGGPLSIRTKKFRLTFRDLQERYEFQSLCRDYWAKKCRKSTRVMEVNPAHRCLSVLYSMSGAGPEPPRPVKWELGGIESAWIRKLVMRTFLVSEFMGSKPR
jgi:hypothetical protein